MNIEILTQPFVELWLPFVGALYLLIPALIVFVVGIAIAKLIYRVLVKIFDLTKIDELIRPLADTVKRAGYTLRAGHVIGWLVKWFIIIASLMSALDIIGLRSARGLLTGIAQYIPQVIVAILVLFAGFILAKFVQKLVEGGTLVFRMVSSKMLGTIAHTSIVVFTFLITLNLLGIGSDIINILLIAFVSMVALAGGLAFGLGGTDVARDILEKIKKKL